LADYTARRIEEMEGTYGGFFKRARAELGVGSFGMAIIDLPPGSTGYPEHDHSHDDQEEVFVALRGGGAVEVDGQRVPFDTETLVRVGSNARRRVLAGDEGVRVLVLGGVPGKPYQPPRFSELGAAETPGAD